MRSEFLGGKLKSLLGRLSPPQSIRNSPQLQKEEVASLYSAVLGHAPQVDYEGWWTDFEAALLDLMQTRAWPTRHEIGKAAGECRGRVQVDEFEAKLNRARAALGKGRKPPFGLTDPMVTREMIREGRFLNEREARFHGWPLTADADAMAIGKPVEGKAHRTDQQAASPAELEAHHQAMGRIKGKTRQEVEAEERAVLSPGEF